MRSADSTFKVKLVCFSFLDFSLDKTRVSFLLVFPFKKGLNYGLLALASYIANKGYEVTICDPQINPSADGLEMLLQEIKWHAPKIVGLSCISGFSYPSCKALATAIRRHFPSIKIIAGGMQHIGEIAQTALEECPALDIIVRGEGELVIGPLIEAIKNNKSLDDIPNIVYRDVNGQIFSNMVDIHLTPEQIPALDYNL